MSTIEQDNERTGRGAIPERVVYLPKPKMPPAAPLVMLKTSPLIRRALPTRLMVARAEARARRHWHKLDANRRHALRTMSAVVSGTEREGELEALALQYMVESEVWDTLFWQPWSMLELDTRSRERALASCTGERGAIFSACHLGPYFHRILALLALGIEPCVVAGDFYFEPPSHDAWGRRLARWRKGLPLLPITRQRGSFQALSALLEQSSPVLLYFDMPGRQETSFLGKTAMMVNGTARLAVETDSLVLPIRTRREGTKVHEEIGEPLDPREFDGVDAVHAELARIHSRLILDFPAAMADPAEFGWRDGASATAWRRPSVDTAQAH